MFTPRTDWNFEPNAIAQCAEELRREGRSILDLTETNPTGVGFRYLQTGLLDYLTEPGGLRYDPDPRGLEPARRAIAETYAARGVEVGPNRIFLTAGTSEAYAHIFRLLIEPGEAVLVPTPSYPLFDFLARFNDVRVASYSLHYDDRWWTDTGSMAAEINSAVRAAVVVSPNNPTGSYVKHSERDAMIELARERRIALVADEVFFDFPLGDDAERAPSFAGENRVLTFTLGGASKALGLPQMKLAWTVVNGPDDLVAAACERLELLCDTYLSVNTPGQQALPAWIARGPEIRDEILTRLRFNLDVCRRRAGDAVQCLDVEGGWSAILRVPHTRSDEEWVLTLLECDNVRVDPGGVYGLADAAYLVVSLLVEPERFEEAMCRIGKRVGAA